MVSLPRILLYFKYLQGPVVFSKKPGQPLQYQHLTHSKSRSDQKPRNNSITMTTRSALLWTIAVGSVLFLLNTVVFLGIYYQARQLRSKPDNIINVTAHGNHRHRDGAIVTDAKVTNGRCESEKLQEILPNQSGRRARDDL